MGTISFDDGYKTYAINGDENRVIRINTSDYALLDRLVEAYKRIESIEKPDAPAAAADSPVEKVAAAAKVINDIESQIRDAIDYIFNTDVCSAAFGAQSALSSIGGVPLYERFLNALLPVVTSDIKSEMAAHKERVGRYTEKVVQFTPQQPRKKRRRRPRQ